MNMHRLIIGIDYGGEYLVLRRKQREILLWSVKEDESGVEKRGMKFIRE